MAFLDGLSVGHSYVLHTPWGQERVRLESVDEDSVTATDTEGGVFRVYRPEVILGYELISAPAAQPSESEPVRDEPASDEAADPDPFEAISLAPLPEPVFDPGPVPPDFERELTKRRYGVIESFFPSPQTTGGFGYIIKEQSDRRARKDGVFFHIRQVSENNLYQLLIAQPMPQPDETGRRRAARLPEPVSVSYLLGDNRAKTHDDRPVAYDVRLTEQSRKALMTQAAHRQSGGAAIGECHYLGSAVAYFYEYNLDTFDQLALKLYIMEEDANRELSLTDQGIVNPYLKRYLEETRPAAPKEMAFSIDLFERPAPTDKRKKRKPSLIGAHATVIGAAPWSAEDEKRWDATLTMAEREAWRLFREPDFAHERFDIAITKDQPLPPQETIPVDDGTAQAPHYTPLEPWTK